MRALDCVPPKASQGGGGFVYQRREGTKKGRKKEFPYAPSFPNAQRRKFSNAFFPALCSVLWMQLAVDRKSPIASDLCFEMAFVHRKYLIFGEYTPHVIEAYYALGGGKRGCVLTLFCDAATEHGRGLKSTRLTFWHNRGRRGCTKRAAWSDPPLSLSSILIWGKGFVRPGGKLHKVTLFWEAKLWKKLSFKIISVCWIFISNCFLM